MRIISEGGKHYAEFDETLYIGNDLLPEIELEYVVRIQFIHQPYEPAETGPEAQYPGMEEKVEIVDAELVGLSGELAGRVRARMLDVDYEQIEEIILDKIERDQHIEKFIAGVSNAFRQ